jgi:hypothetical protein
MSIEVDNSFPAESGRKCGVAYMSDLGYAYYSILYIGSLLSG